MNQRTRTSSRRIADASRAADAQALRAARGISLAATGIESLPQLGIETLPNATISTPGLAPWTHKSREECIAEAAYLRAESRGFEPGHELEDWLLAEQTVDAMLAAE